MKKIFQKMTASVFFVSLVLAFSLFVSCEQPPGKIPSTVDDETLVYSNKEIYISSPEDFISGVNADRQLTGMYALTKNITLENWVPIGDDAKPFHGVLDGKGHTITLISFDDAAVSGKTYLGIFGYVKGALSQKAKIKNLSVIASVDAVSTMTGGQAVGLVAGEAELAEIDGITLSGTFDFYSESGKTAYAGGIAGIISETMVKNSNTSVSMNIKPGYGDPLVYGLPNPFSFVGGIAGIFLKESEIHNCHNSGNVSGISETAGSQLMVGGIAGGSFYAFTPEWSGMIADCSSAGDITVGCMHYWPFAGGIAGTVCGGGWEWESKTRIERCYATGTVKAENINPANTMQWPYIGGIAGYVYMGAGVSRCWFDGTVMVNRINDYAGGIAGYSSNASYMNNAPCVIEDCWSAGEVKGFNNAGGIVGQNQQNTLLKRCYSLMQISVTNNANGPNITAQWGVGGITGSHSSANHEDAMEACVALNPSVYAPLGDEIHRITGRMQAAGGIMPKMTNNYAPADLFPVTDDPEKQFEWKKGRIDAQDGEDIPGEYLAAGKPTQSFYEFIGWDFATVWKMGDDGYPKLR